MKEILDLTRKNFITWLIMFVVGFGLGRAITYNNIVADCEVLGMFRVGDYGAQCRISDVPAKDPKK
jgi:hypothetical protein